MGEIITFGVLWSRGLKKNILRSWGERSIFFQGLGSKDLSRGPFLWPYVLKSRYFAFPRNQCKLHSLYMYDKVQVGKDQEKAQSEKDWFYDENVKF